ncbi:MAG: hypothetical protein ACI9D4_001625 [Polaribacter sp.]|jgi:hypothetical protein
MKHKLLLFLLIFTTFCFGQITIDQTNTEQELIEDVLIGNPNFPSSNFGMSTGTDYGDVNGIAAFNKNATDFAFSGIVLTSGNVINVPGPNLDLLNEGGVGWPGDADLEEVTGSSNTINASSLQFDFVPAVSQISIEFILASEEYNQNFECTFDDAIAFILTNNSTGFSENIALIPDNDTPIKATTIHPEVPGQCGAINEAYFDTYNFEPFLPEDEALINYNGQTVTFLNIGELIIGDLYTLKIVIADATDTAYDSALFVRGGSFGAFPVMEEDPENIFTDEGDGDGLAIFDLTINEALMLGGIDTNVYSFLFSYYLSEDDAEQGINPIVNLEGYQNIENPQTIHVRMENAYTGAHIQNSFEIETDGILSVNDLFSEQFLIYPNPVENILKIDMLESFEDLEISIYSIEGRLLISEEIKNNTTAYSIDLSLLTPSIYFLKIRSEDGKEISKKIVKN